MFYRSYCTAQKCEMWRWSPASDLMRLISGALGTFCKFPSPRTSPTRKFASVPLNLMSSRRSWPGVWGSPSATSSVRIQMRTTRGPSALASTIRRRSGDDHAVVLDKRVRLRTTSNNRTWGCGLPGTEHYDRELWCEIVETATLQQG